MRSSGTGVRAGIPSVPPPGIFSLLTACFKNGGRAPGLARVVLSLAYRAVGYVKQLSAVRGAVRCIRLACVTGA